MRDNLGETENEVEYENLRAKEALLMLRNNEVALVEEQVFLFCVVVFFVLYCVGGVVVQHETEDRKIISGITHRFHHDLIFKDFKGYGANNSKLKLDVVVGVIVLHSPVFALFTFQSFGLYLDVCAYEFLLETRKFLLMLSFWYDRIDSFVTAVEVEIDGSVTVETVGNTAIGEVSSIADDNREGGSSVEPNDNQDQHDNGTQDSSGGITIPSAIPTVSVVSVEEPYVGQEFGSEAAAHAFYNAYATEVGFIVRVSKLSRSRRDGTAIGRTLVCNKEGFRMADKREKIVRQRAETRVGCRAMIMVRKLSSGKWVVAKFVKEHTHPLTPGKGRRDFYYEQYPTEQDKIRELSQQLATEKKRSAAYKRHLELIFEQIEEQNDNLSKKIQHIVDCVKEMEAKEEHSRQCEGDGSQRTTE
ncbi:Protein FAR1-RELATED SEQUENCE 5 isoform C [Glycine soja]|uniref:Protein FAR1-RELATED SEQUENCE 5 isoform C n=1 Tax=Glycine soja TaxID=3848 RepID=A0A445I168_GLYSO|nr:Protein FAR1-RELATED SEQUENCE 5 isoform C [Glycine soja]